MNRSEPVVVNVVGARPQFVKAGPVSRALAEHGIRELLLHTGQHYDDLMSDHVMNDVGLRPADINLGVGSESHGVQTARILEGVEAALLDRPVSAVLTYGDTNSTIAAALAATKLHVPTAHVEAGLRSFNRMMPEELNRIATDHLSDLLLAPTDTAMQHLAAEGLGPRAVKTGDVMVDALRSIDFDRVALPEWAKGSFYVATVHRAENTDDPERLSNIITSLEELDKPVHLLAHPRLSGRIEPSTTDGALRIHPPLSYAAMLSTVRASAGLFTDSGGLQKEAYILRVKCVTLRSETEWPETLQGSWNVLASPTADLSALANRTTDDARDAPFGYGHAAEEIVTAVRRLW